jgi:hypothetical protein
VKISQKIQTKANEKTPENNLKISENKPTKAKS